MHGFSGQNVYVDLVVNDPIYHVTCMSFEQLFRE